MAPGDWTYPGSEARVARHGRRSRAADADAVRSILDELRDLRIGVFGDFCVDAYAETAREPGERSLETGKRARVVAAFRPTLGGAGNVAANLATLGVGAVYAFGVVGADMFGRELRRLCEAAGVDCAALAVQRDGWSTPAYVKVLTPGRSGPCEIERLDFGGSARLDRSVAGALLSSLERRLSQLDAVIVNQQVRPGVHCGDLHWALQALVQRTDGVLWMNDRRDTIGDYGDTVLKVNRREARVATGERDPRRAAAQLFGDRGRPIFVTGGAAGAIVHDVTGHCEVPAVRVSGAVDSVGAGDAFLAGVAVAMAAGRSAPEAAVLGTYAAAVTVTKVGQAGTANHEEVLALAGAHEASLAVLSPDR